MAAIPLVILNSYAILSLCFVIRVACFHLQGVLPPQFPMWAAQEPQNFKHIAGIFLHISVFTLKYLNDKDCGVLDDLLCLAQSWFSLHLFNQK